MSSNPKTQTFTSLGKTSQHTIPGGYSRFGSAGTRAGTVSTSNLVFVGQSLGGKPQEILWFSSAPEALATLRGGNLVEIVREAFDPGDDLVPQRVGVVRANSATQSTLYLLNGVSNIIKLTSKDYGLYTTQIYAKVSAGDVAGKKISAKLSTDQQDTKDIQRKSFSIQYTNSGTTCTLTITNTTLSTNCSTSGHNLSLTLADYPTLEALVAAINATGNYTAVVLGDGQASSLVLDNVTAVDIKTAVVTLYSNVQAIIEEINAQLTYFTAELASGAARLVPDNTSWTKMTGGSEGSLTSTEWSNAFTYLETQDVQLVGIDRADASIGSAVSTHITRMNGVEGKNERQAILGGTTSFDNSLNEAPVYGNFAVCLAWAEFTNYDSNNNLSDFSSQHYAAKLLGQAAALGLNTPMTFKNLKMISLKTKLTKVQKENAILAGVIVPEETPTGTIRTVRSVTTYQGNDLKYTEFSMVREMLFISRDLRTLLENTFIGKAGTAGALVSVESVSKDRLVDYEKVEEIIVADPNNRTGNPAWKDFIWTISGDTIRVQFKANIVSPINFMFITSLFDILVTI